MKKIAIYSRKSVEVKDSISLETQIEMCKNYFLDVECTFEIFSDDGFTGANINRPAFKKLNRLLELKTFDVLVCYKLDRISRKVLDIADFFELLEKNNIDFVCVKDKYDTGTPMGRAMLYFASVFAQLERETIAERVTDAMLNLAKRGCWTGGPAPVGYKLIKNNGKSYLELDNENFIKDCFNLYMENESLYKVHKKLKNKYPDLAPANRDTIGRILRSPIYVKSSETIHNYLNKKNWEVIGEYNGNGYLTYGKTKGNSMAIASTHTSIIEPGMWLKIQEKLDFKREDYFKKESKVYWLSGILRCPYCGSEYIICNSNRNTYYVCSNRLRRDNRKVELCKNNKYINAIKIEKTIEEYISSCKNKKIFNNVYKPNINNNDEDIISIKDAIEKNNKMIDNLVDKIALMNNADILINKINSITEKNKELNEKLQNLRIENIEIESYKFNENYIFENVFKFNKELAPEIKRVVVRNIFKNLIYDPIKDTLEVEFL